MRKLGSAKKEEKVSEEIKAIYKNPYINQRNDIGLSMYTEAFRNPSHYVNVLRFGNFRD